MNNCKYFSLSEKLLTKLKDSNISNENLIEKSWKISFLTLLLEEDFQDQVDIKKALKMAILKDISNAFEVDPSEDQKKAKKRAIKAFFNEVLEENKTKSITSTLKELRKNESVEAQLINYLYDFEHTKNSENCCEGPSKIFPWQTQETDEKESADSQMDKQPQEETINDKSPSVEEEAIDYQNIKEEFQKISTYLKTLAKSLDIDLKKDKKDKKKDKKDKRKDKDN